MQRRRSCCLVVFFFCQLLIWLSPSTCPTNVVQYSSHIPPGKDGLFPVFNDAGTFPADWNTFSSPEVYKTLRILQVKHRKEKEKMSFSYLKISSNTHLTGKLTN